MTESQTACKTYRFARVSAINEIMLICIRINFQFRGTGHYLSPGGAEDFRGDHLIFERKKGGSVVTKNPRGRSLKILEEFRGGDLSNLLGK